MDQTMIRTTPTGEPAPVAAGRLWHSWSPAGTSGQADMVVTDGRGCEISTREGRTFLDARAGMFNSVLGYGRSDVIKAITRQLNRLMTYTLTQAATEPALELADRLAVLLGGGLTTTFFAHSGSEANETAVKIARGYFELTGRSERRVVVTLDDGYHGSTLATAAMSGLPAARAGNGPLPGGFVQARAPRCADCREGREHEECVVPGPEAVEQVILAAGEDRVAAVVLEPVLGVAGVWPLPDGYLAAVRQMCDQYGVLLVLDEVMTGFGRTGRWFGFQHHGMVVPDIVTTCKGLTGGYQPLSSVTCRPELADAFAADPLLGGFRHGFTTGGHAAACAAALAVLDAIEAEDLVGNAARLGSVLLDGLEPLQKLPHVRDVRGRGLLAAVEFSDAALADEVGRLMAEDGVLVRLQGPAVTLAPPLVIDRQQVERIVTAVRAAAGALR